MLTRGLGTAAGTVGTGSEAVNSGCAVPGAPGPAGVCTGLLTPPLGQGARTFPRARTACGSRGHWGWAGQPSSAPHRAAGPLLFK